MNVLLVGSGGREHAIAEAIYRSKRDPKLYSVMADENPGITDLSEDFFLIKRSESKDAPAIEVYNREILEYAVKSGIEIAIIGPETPLSDGLADFLWDAGIPVVGPRKDAAQIEFDKAWMRNFMKKYGIEGCPDYRIFIQGEDNLYDIGRYLDELNASGKDAVIKPAGLTGGKGVKLRGEHFDFEGAKNYAMEVLANDGLVIEEKLIGEEFTVQAFVDGENLAFAPAVQDHKRLKEGDEGPNTGGMGSYSDAKGILPFMEESDYEDAKKIMIKTVQDIKKETGVPYKGILYGQFMANAKGVSVIEFNARFGDPEAMNILPLLENDFIDVCMDIAEGRRSPNKISFGQKATVCKYVVPRGYPEKGGKGIPIKIGNTGRARIYYAGAYEKNGKLYTTGSRAVAVLGIADTMEEAESIAEEGLRGISSDNQDDLYARHDIGKAYLIEKRILKMAGLRKKKKRVKRRVNGNTPQTRPNS